MELVKMGKVLVAAKIENLDDLLDFEHGRRTSAEVRTIEVQNALVDTGATMLSMPKRFVSQLGLRRYKTRTARTTAGIFSFGGYSTVRLTVQGRECHIDVCEVPDECPVLIGQVPLEMLDWVVDPVGQRLIGNPDHGGEEMIDLF